MVWTRPKRLGPDQNNLYSSKTICSVQNHFGPIEGQGTILSGFSNSSKNFVAFSEYMNFKEMDNN